MQEIVTASRNILSVLFFTSLVLPSQLSFIPFTSYSIKYPSSWVQWLQGLLPGHLQIVLQRKRFTLWEAHSLLWLQQEVNKHKFAFSTTHLTMNIRITTWAIKIKNTHPSRALWTMFWRWHSSGRSKQKRHIGSKQYVLPTREGAFCIQFLPFGTRKSFMLIELVTDCSVSSSKIERSWKNHF